MQAINRRDAARGVGAAPAATPFFVARRRPRPALDRGAAAADRPARLPGGRRLQHRAGRRLHAGRAGANHRHHAGGASADRGPQGGRDAGAGRRLHGARAEVLRRYFRRRVRVHPWLLQRDRRRQLRAVPRGQLQGRLRVVAGVHPLPAGLDLPLGGPDAVLAVPRQHDVGRWRPPVRAVQRWLLLLLSRRGQRLPPVPERDLLRRRRGGTMLPLPSRVPLVGGPDRMRGVPRRHRRRAVGVRAVPRGLVRGGHGLGAGLRPVRRGHLRAHGRAAGVHRVPALLHLGRRRRAELRLPAGDGERLLRQQGLRAVPRGLLLRQRPKRLPPVPGGPLQRLGGRHRVQRVPGRLEGGLPRGDGLQQLLLAGRGELRVPRGAVQPKRGVHAVLPSAVVPALYFGRLRRGSGRPVRALHAGVRRGGLHERQLQPAAGRRVHALRGRLPLCGVLHRAGVLPVRRHGLRAVLRAVPRQRLVRAGAVRRAQRHRVRAVPRGHVVVVIGKLHAMPAGAVSALFVRGVSRWHVLEPQPNRVRRALRRGGVCGHGGLVRAVPSGLLAGRERPLRRRRTGLRFLRLN